MGFLADKWPDTIRSAAKIAMCDHGQSPKTVVVAIAAGRLVKGEPAFAIPISTVTSWRNDERKRRARQAQRAIWDNAPAAAQGALINAATANLHAQLAIMRRTLERAATRRNDVEPETALQWAKVQREHQRAIAELERQSEPAPQALPQAPNGDTAPEPPSLLEDIAERNRDKTSATSKETLAAQAPNNEKDARGTTAPTQ